MIELLQTIIHTLDTIHVHGTIDMQKMIGCMEALKTIIAEERRKQDSEGDGEMTDGGQSN